MILGQQPESLLIHDTDTDNHHDNNNNDDNDDDGNGRTQGSRRVRKQLCGLVRRVVIGVHIARTRSGSRQSLLVRVAGRLLLGFESRTGVRYEQDNTR